LKAIDSRLFGFAWIREPNVPTRGSALTVSLARTYCLIHRLLQACRMPVNCRTKEDQMDTPRQANVRIRNVRKHEQSEKSGLARFGRNIRRVTLAVKAAVPGEEPQNASDLVLPA
jgi:hypothetical protein